MIRQLLLLKSHCCSESVCRRLVDELTDSHNDVIWSSLEGKGERKGEGEGKGKGKEKKRKDKGRMKRETRNRDHKQCKQL